ncbi:hypothetical protein INR49_024398 [Caranx melampygus]|nr:hypothetical protein INR49_024398 [Caranx melampygus]
MVKNKNRRSSALKLADSQIASNKVLTPLDDPAKGDIAAASPEHQTAGQVQLGFSDRVYLLAATIFQNNHLEKPAAHRVVNYGKDRGLPLPEVKDKEMCRTAYELTFNTLKYQELLEDIMIDSGFYFSQPIPDDQMGLVAVILYDFQDRKFLPRKRSEEEEIIQEVRDVENCLLRFKTKLAASLARCRIKRDLLSIECILPESVKTKQERSSSLPLYTWVNTLKSSHDEVQSALRSAGFSQVKWIGQLEGQSFCQDPHCGDILVFPAQLKAQLYSTKLLSEHKLIIQDKSCSLGPIAVCSMLPEDGDVLMVGCFSGLTVYHTASLIAEKHKANSSNLPTVYVCVSDCMDAQREDLQQAISAMGCKNVKLIPEVFQSLDGGDKRLQKVRVILLTPKCSVSAVSNPVEFILQENGVPKVSAVVYSTCSSYPEENEEVVRRALEQARACSEQEGEPKQANFRSALVSVPQCPACRVVCLSPFRQASVKVPPHLRQELKETQVSPSLFNSSNNAEDPEETEPFFVLEPSAQSNGCFLAVLTREPEPEVNETPQEVLARANAKGILDRINSNQSTRKEHRGRTGRIKKAACARNSQPHLSVCVQSKHQETKGGNSVPLYGRQESTSRQQPSQGKPKALRQHALKNTTSSPFSSSKQESSWSCSSSSSSKPENSTSSKSITPVSSTTTTSITSPQPAPAPPLPLLSVLVELIRKC